MKKCLIICCVLFAAITVQGQEGTIFGKWKTIDDATGEARSIIEIYEENNKAFGKILEIFDPENRDRLCGYCKGNDKNKPVLGLVIIKNLKKDENEYSDGTIFDPENGKEYTAKIWLDEDDPNILNVRGYISFFFRTQRWVRVEG